tara:strand:+ start:738 stop:1334 length:597 start_codon:yes stop_codon:yes gene_type:complete
MSFFENILDFLIYLDSGLGIFFFVVIYIFVVLLILPASWLSIAAGYLYGTYLGSVIVFISAFIGASISFFISKRFLSKKVLDMINKYPKLSLLENIIQKGGLKLIVLTRLSPLFPFSILNYFYGLNNITYKDFSISLICIIPGTFLYCSVGSLLNDLSDIVNLKLNNNLFTTLISIISTSLIIYFLSKYSNEIINESK